MNQPIGKLTAGLARAVKVHRERKGWTLDGLATRSGVSKGMLVQVEKSRVNPSLATLVRIADALGVTVASLIEVEDRPRVQVRSVAEQKALWRGRSTSLARLLGASDRGAHVESWHWTFAPGDGYQSHAHPPGSTEHLVILRGHLRLSVGGEDFAVGEGASVVFDADHDHGYWNASARESVTFVMSVITPERGAADVRGPGGSSRPLGVKPAREKARAQAKATK